MTYEFVASTVRDSAGEEGMKFFPLIFSLFIFILVLNLFGMMPYGFTVTSHIVITFALAMIVMGTVVIYGFAKHGLNFLNLFVPSGVPGYILPLVVLIEVISFISRPISLAVRLFANMLAGHIALKIFAYFVAGLLAAGAWGVLSPAAAGARRGADRARVPGRLPAGLRVHHPRLHLPQRRPPPRPLTPIPSGRPSPLFDLSRPLKELF